MLPQTTTATIGNMLPQDFETIVFGNFVVILQPKH